MDNGAENRQLEALFYPVFKMLGLRLLQSVRIVTLATGCIAQGVYPADMKQSIGGPRPTKTHGISTTLREAVEMLQTQEQHFTGNEASSKFLVKANGKNPSDIWECRRLGEQASREGVGSGGYANGQSRSQLVEGLSA